MLAQAADMVTCSACSAGHGNIFNRTCTFSEILKASLAHFNPSWAGNLRCHQGTTTRDPAVR